MNLLFSPCSYATVIFGSLISCQVNKKIEMEPMNASHIFAWLTLCRQSAWLLRNFIEQRQQAHLEDQEPTCPQWGK